MRKNLHPRRGNITIEFALVAPVALLLILGPIIGGLGVFRYQQVAGLAREGSRYASVHGKQYQKVTGQPAATEQNIKDFMAAKAVGMSLTNITSTVTWNLDNSPTRTQDAYGNTLTDAGGNVMAVTNTVTVTVSYRWLPEAFWGGVTMTSTSQSPMWY